MKKEEYFLKFGYDAFGPILLAFCRWIKKYCSENEVKKIFFLSRDGKIVNEAYSLLYKEDEKNIEYFHASRRAIIVPSLYNINSIDEIFNRIAFNKKIKMSKFLKKVGLDDYDVSEILKKYNLDYEYIINIENFSHEPKFKYFLEEILPIIKLNAEKEYKAFFIYAKKKSLTGKVAIVDIGWFGSMQKAFNEIENSLDIHGLYVGMVPNGKILNSKQAKGFLFDSEHGKNLYDKFHYFINIFEYLFLAQEGSTKRYCNNEIGYELYDYEYDNIDESKYSKIIQNGAMTYIKDNLENESINMENCTDKILKYMLHPKYIDAKIFGDLLFLDDEKLNIAKPKKLIKYIFNYKSFISDFKESAWRIGFLKRLIKVPMPYYQLNKLLRRGIKE